MTPLATTDGIAGVLLFTPYLVFPSVFTGKIYTVSPFSSAQGSPARHLKKKTF
jgi:hypothetical protein